MNEMYEMSIVTHYYSVVGVLIVILMNFFMLYKAIEIPQYKRKMSLFTPIASFPIAGVIFTGIVMMAAKHLEFSIENIVMIVFSIAIVLLEVKRVKTLKYLTQGFVEYKKLATNILLVESSLTLSISAWMLI